MIKDLQTVIDALRSNPDILQTGTKAGPYSIAYGKVWRGNAVIGYASKPPVEGVPIQILYTSQTSPEEAAVFESPAPPTPASAPAMTLNSPEGKASEEKSGAEQPPPTPAPAPSGGGGEESGGEAGGREVVGPGGKAQEKPASGAEGAVFKRGKGGKKPLPTPPRDVARLGAPRGESFYPEEYAVLNEARMEESRRKLLKANAVVEFDLECKNVTRGVWVHLWLLPCRRLDGKFELYTHTVTATCNVPSVFAIKRELVGAMQDQMPHIIVSPASLDRIAHRINLAMSAAKDSLGGSQKSESVEEEIAGYLTEDSGASFKEEYLSAQ